ncbi:PepSY domain-containing protein [Brevibacterium ravenspurgense]|uniref:PepSY domain-containing protein n=1 Tax=Brevibacterium ravenspurgense TaxID=479117 RepID=UPI001EF1F059|nr:PepSY domain-containing protein [Brevibacterium ravenspurgense]MCG7300759.1 PepSY domain-containing protein [Brevibacterium ravenspurgense]
MTKLSTLLAASAAAGALALAGCGNSEEEPQIEDAQPTTQAEGSSSESAAASGESQNEKGGSLDQAQAAIDLAEKEISGAAAEMDFDDGRWEIDVIKGTEKHEVVVNAEGTEVLNKEKDDDQADQKDVDALKKAKTSLKDALRIAVDEKGGGTLDEADLETGSTPAWEIEVYPEGKTDSIDVYVSVTDGKIVDEPADD